MWTQLLHRRMSTSPTTAGLAGSTKCQTGRGLAGSLAPLQDSARGEGGRGSDVSSRWGANSNVLLIVGVVANHSGQGGACRAALLWWGSIALQKQSSTPVHDAFLMDYNAPVHWEMLAVPMFCWMCLRSDAPIPLLFLQLSTKRLPRLRRRGRQRPAGPDGGGGPRRGRRGSPRTAAAVQRVLAWVCTMRAHAISHMTARTHGEHNISHMSCGAHNISTCDVARIKTAHDIWRASYQKNWEYAPQPAWP